MQSYVGSIDDAVYEQIDTKDHCRGPYCVLAIEAVEILRANGFNAIRLDEGIQDWRAKGLPLEVSD